ncbi:hypothetical protein VTU32_06590 [Thermoanaerobacter sp. CM-CNRG TB177]|uniref:hypothetical protein n=1 Tax=Thermoanaerobacter sp. CM-CNRG TB177 TaxID=2800659 RepID=UPI001BDF2EF0|nr:hypothetical protein [Thermoanaerobacter sp. CM-CNRG TB177]MBT1278964.1 hypothetical protein [Thermoanaerobacter sp. CM-CNRG TB177]
MNLHLTFTKKVMTALTNLKKDKKGLNEYVAVASLLALVAGIAVLVIPNARTTISNLWNNTLSSMSSLFQSVASGK